MPDPTASAPGDSPDADGWEHREQFREGVVMALYIGLSLLAVLLVSGNPQTPQSSRPVAGTIFLTALGLVLAHQVAFRLATRLVSKGELGAEARSVLRAQWVAGISVSVLAAVPVLILGGEGGLLVSELLMLALVAVTGYAVGRAAGRSRLRSLAYVASVAVVVSLVLAVKLAVDH